MCLLGNEFKAKIALIEAELKMYKEANETLRKQITNGKG